MCTGKMRERELCVRRKRTNTNKRKEKKRERDNGDAKTSKEGCCCDYLIVSLDGEHMHSMRRSSGFFLFFFCFRRHRRQRQFKPLTCVDKRAKEKKSIYFFVVFLSSFDLMRKKNPREKERTRSSTTVIAESHFWKMHVDMSHGHCRCALNHFLLHYL